MKVIYFSNDSGRRPVEDFIKSLNIHTRNKFFSSIELLAKFGRTLAFPHAKYLGREIFELRFNGLEGTARVLYFFFDGEKVILTNAFIKKSNKTPKQEIETAVNRRKAYFQTHKGGIS